jgi:hypothetical protein
MHVGTSCTKSEQYLLAIQFMSTFRRAEEMQFQQFNQGEYLDVHNVKQVWNGPVAAAFDDNNRECPSGCSRVIQNLFRLGNDDVCETFRKEVRAKIKIWKMALYHTKFRTGHSSYFWFLRERERERERYNHTKETGGKCSKCRWTLSKWNIDDALGLVPDFSENAGDGPLQRLSVSSESVTGSVLQQQFKTLYRNKY